MLQKLVVLLVVAVLMTGCGGSGGGSSSTPGQAQGIYADTTTYSEGFEAIILPNDKFYAL